MAFLIHLLIVANVMLGVAYVTALLYSLHDPQPEKQPDTRPDKSYFRR